MHSKHIKILRVVVTISLNSRCYESTRFISPFNDYDTHPPFRDLWGEGTKTSFCSNDQYLGFYLLYKHQFTFPDSVKTTEFDLFS